MRVLNYFSLFSGIGSFERALSLEGVPFNLVGYSEIDEDASLSYAAMHNIDQSKNYGDITKIDATKLPKNIDLITYGFPCQDISNAGNQAGFFNGKRSLTRSGLFFSALDIIEACMPKVAIAENVKALMTSKFKNEFSIVINSLELAGYVNYYALLKASRYGSVEERERVIIVSIREDVDVHRDFEFPLGEENKDSLLGFAKVRDCDDITANFIRRYESVHGVLLDEQEFRAYLKDLPTRKNAIHTKKLGLYGFNEMDTVTLLTGHTGTLTCRNVQNYNKKYLIEGSLYKPSPLMCWLIMGYSKEDFDRASTLCEDKALYNQAGNTISVYMSRAIIKAISSYLGWREENNLYEEGAYVRTP